MAGRPVPPWKASSNAQLWASADSRVPLGRAQCPLARRGPGETCANDARSVLILPCLGAQGPPPRTHDPLRAGDTVSELLVPGARGVPRAV